MVVTYNLYIVLIYFYGVICSRLFSYSYVSSKLPNENSCNLKNIVFLSCRTWDIQDIKNNVYAIYLFIVGGKYY